MESEIYMINRENNPDFLNSFLDYSATILNKSPNTIKEYNYDIAHFLKFIQYEFGVSKLNDDDTIKSISVKNMDLSVVEKITLENIHVLLHKL